MDVPESLINAYLQNSGALGLFASSTSATGLNIHANDQWSHQANIRVVVQQPPQTAPWIGLNMFLDHQDHRPDQPDGQPGRQRHQRRHRDDELDGHGEPGRQPG